MPNDLDLSGLPNELLQQLSSVSKGWREFICDVIMENGGRATLDELLILIYRKTKKVTKRSALYQRTLKMQNENILSKSNGVYTLVDKTKSH